MSVVFTADEWKNAFSRTNQEMKDDWTKIFNAKLTSSGIECVLKFKTPYIKEGERMRNCRFCGCFAKCTISICKRVYQMIIQSETPQIDHSSPCHSSVTSFQRKNTVHSIFLKHQCKSIFYSLPHMFMKMCIFQCNNKKNSHFHPIIYLSDSKIAALSSKTN
jgi:hypothetical protein